MRADCKPRGWNGSGYVRDEILAGAARDHDQVTSVRSCE